MPCAISGAYIHRAGISSSRLVCAAIDLDEITRDKFDLDVAGRYSRPDVFDLKLR
jgi:hypothetical protein